MNLVSLPSKGARTPSHAATNVEPNADPQSLTKLAEVFSNPANRTRFQVCPVAVAACLTAIQPKILAAVVTHASQRVHINMDRLTTICNSELPVLLFTQSVGGSEPIAEIVLKLSDIYISEMRTAETQVLSILQQRRTATPEHQPHFKICDNEGLLSGDGPSPLAGPSDADSEVNFESALAEAADDILTEAHSNELKELEREVLLQEYVSEMICALFDDLEQTDRMIAELFYLHNFDCEDIATIVSKSPTVVSNIVSNLRDVWLPRHQSDSLCSAWNKVRRDIERQDLKLNESQGVTLLLHLLLTYPNVRRSAELVNLVADSGEFFRDLLISKRPELVAFRNADPLR